MSELSIHLAIFALPLASGILLADIDASAQLIPDRTLGAESSVVVPGEAIDGIESDRLDGGARRGANLFHSFQEFNIDDGRGAYFSNPVGVENILTRVTGGNPSNILGTLGVLGDANLFFINPNGIVFGPNARLNLGGSFVASTADGLLFDNDVEFSASNPQAPPLLTANLPIGLQFRENPGSIVNRSQPGLELESGNSFALVGGDLIFENGVVNVPEGAIELASLASGKVGIDMGEGRIAIADFDVLNGGNISLSGDARVDSSGDRSGTIQIRGGNVSLRDRARIESNTVNGNGGDIAIDTQNLSLQDFAVILVSTSGIGAGGDLIINAANSIQLVGTREPQNFIPTIVLDLILDLDPNIIVQLLENISSEDLEDAQARTALIENIGESSFMLLENLIHLSDTTRSSTISDLVLPVLINLELDGIRPSDINSGLYSTALASGSGGNLKIDTSNFYIQNNMLVLSANINNGLAGDVSVRASSNLDIVGSGSETSFGVDTVDNLSLLDLLAVVEFVNSGIIVASLDGERVGNLSIDTGNISIRDSGGMGRITLVASGTAEPFTVNASGRVTIAEQSSLLSLSLGDGNAGGIRLNALNGIEITNRSGIRADTISNGTGGDIILNTNRLFLSDRGEISTTSIASPFGSGNAGSITIDASEAIEIQNLSSLLAEARSDGNAGNITLNTSRLRILAGEERQSGISTVVVGSGQGGNITISASESVEFVGKGFLNIDGLFNLLEFFERERLLLINARRLFTGLITASFGFGGSGNITINVPSLILRDGAVILTSTFGKGDGGLLTVNSSELITIDELSGLLTTTFAEGNAGNININGEQLSLLNGSVVSADTFAIEVLEGLQGIDEDLRPFLPDAVDLGRGDAGDVTIAVDRLELLDGSRIGAATGQNTTGTGGTVTINARELIDIIGTSEDGTVPSGLFANTQGSGIAGNLIISTPLLLIRDGGESRVSGEGSGAAGNIIINSESVRLDRGLLTSNTLVGEGAEININSRDIVLKNRSDITTNAGNLATGGDINIDTGVMVGIGNSDIIANAELGSAGRIEVSADGILGFEVLTLEDIQEQLGDNLTIASPNQLPGNNITAFSVQSPQLSGQVIFNTPDVNSTQGILELPETVVDPNELISQNPCTQGTRSEFTDIGSGGLRTSPDEVPDREVVPAPWIDPVTDRDRLTDATDTQADRPSPEPIVPARGWVLTENGRVEFTADEPATIALSSQSRSLHQTCTSP